MQQRHDLKKKWMKVKQKEKNSKVKKMRKKRMRIQKRSSSIVSLNGHARNHILI
jgi:hypothetical protein